MSNNKTNNNFHLLRHLAAMLVLYAHVATAFGQFEPIYIASGGRIELSSLGVKMFFIISGFLVTKSRLRTDNRVHFAEKRWLRLWPAMAAVTILLAILVGPKISTLNAADYFSQSQTWLFLVRNLCFFPVYRLPGVLQGEGINSPFWTLFFECICYLLLFLIPKKWLVKSSLLLVCGILISAARYLPIHFPAIANNMQDYWYGITNMMLLFSFGSLYQIWFSQKAGKKYWLLIAAIIFLSTTLFPIPFYIHSFLQDLSLVVLIIEAGRAKAIGRWPAWDISYGIYLLAYPVQMITAAYWPLAGGNEPALLLATLLLTIPLAFASWYGVERPFLRLKPGGYQRQKI